MHISEPLTTRDFFALDVDEKVKVELIGGALCVSPSPMPWHNRVANRLFRILEDVLGDEYVVFTDLDMIVDEENVLRPDVFVIDRAAYGPHKVAQAGDVQLAIEVVSPSSRINDRQVKPMLYCAVGVPSWRIERTGDRLYLVETPIRGQEKTHLGPVTLKVAGIDVPIDLDAMALYALGSE